MRVLMVQTPSVEGISSERVYPIGIVLLAGCLKGAGHDVEIIDMNLQADPFGALKMRSWRIPSARVSAFHSGISTPLGTRTFPSSRPLSQRPGSALPYHPGQPL